MNISDFLYALYDNTVNGNIKWDINQNNTYSNEHYFLSADTKFNGNNYSVRLESGNDNLYIDENYENIRTIKLDSKELIDKKEEIIDLVTEFYESDQELFDNIIISFCNKRYDDSEDDEWKWVPSKNCKTDKKREDVELCSVEQLRQIRSANKTKNNEDNICFGTYCRSSE